MEYSKNVLYRSSGEVYGVAATFTYSSGSKSFVTAEVSVVAQGSILVRGSAPLVFDRINGS